MGAAYSGQLDVVKLLIEKGANKEAESNVSIALHNALELSCLHYHISYCTI